MRGVDVFIADCSCTVEEHPARKGWGHGIYSSSIATAKAAGAKMLFCTDHEPTRSDNAPELAFAAALVTNVESLQGLDVRLAKEGDVYEF